MICKNCHKEIGQRTDCNLCGFDPAKDGPNAPKVNNMTFIQPPPAKVTLKEKTNGMAVAAFVCALFSWFPICWFLSFIFGIIGLKRVKTCRTGSAMSIISLIIWFIGLVLTVLLVIFFFEETGISLSDLY